MRFSKAKFRAFGLLAFMAGTFICGSANAGPSICGAVSGNLIQNCGFETGDFTNWVTHPAASGSLFYVGGPGNSGSFNAWFGATGTQVDQISQGVPTIPGHLYELDYYYTSDGDTPNQGFSGYFNGSFHLLSGGTDIPATDWTPSDFTFVATTNSTGIIFGALDVPGFIGIDDVVLKDVTPVPEPFTLGMFGAGLAGAAAMRRFKKKSA